MDDVIELAREAGVHESQSEFGNTSFAFQSDTLHKFYSLARADLEAEVSASCNHSKTASPAYRASTCPCSRPSGRTAKRPSNATPAQSAPSPAACANTWSGAATMEIGMEKYLYRITTKKTDVWSKKEPKSVYFVADSKEVAEKWAAENLQRGLSVAKVTRLAVQVGGHVFTAL